jgi:hypothetical protein
MSEAEADLIVELTKDALLNGPGGPLQATSHRI